MAEFKIEISKFLGRNIKVDPEDINQHEAQTLDRFDVSTKPGALIKSKGYTDQASVSLPASYPSSWTIVNFFQFKVNKPSAQTITMVHAQVGGEDRIYVDYTYDGSSWNQAWVELTENEEGYLIDSSADTSHFVCTSVANDTDNYYNGWVVIDWSITTELGARLISDYDGGTNTFTLDSALTGLSSSQIISLYRFPLAAQIEGIYTMDTGSSTTQVYDGNDFSTYYYEIHSDIEDVYNGWTLVNITQGTSKAITDYESNYAGNNRRIVHSAIASQTDGDTYLIVKTLRTLNVDDKIQFRQRPNVCIMSLGNSSAHLNQYPLWYGYIRSNYYFGQTDKSINAGYYLEPSVLAAPDDACLSDTTEPVSLSDDLEAGDYYFALAYVYDGYQVGAMTSANRAQTMAYTADGSHHVRVEITCGFGVTPCMSNNKVLNKRVTAIELYASNDFDIEKGSGAWYRIVRIPIRQDYDFGYGGTKPLPSNLPVIKPELGIGGKAIINDSGRISEDVSHESLKFDWSGSDPYAIVVNVFGSTWTNKGFPYTAVSGGVGGDFINYAVGDENKDHAVVGKLFSGETEDSLISYSPITVDGTPSFDYFPPIMVEDLANHGIQDIYDIKIISNKVYVQGASKALRMIIGGGYIPNFRVDAEFDYLGSESSNGILKYNGGVITVTKKGVYFLDNNEHLLSYPIEDTTTPPLGMSDMSEAYVGFNGKTNDVYIVFPTDSKLLVWNTITKQWSVNSLADGIKALVTDKDGNIFGADASKIYKLNNGTTDDSTSINPQWKSKVYSSGRYQAILNDAEITYRSDTVIQFDVYIDRGSASSWNNATDNQLAAATTTTTTKLKLPNGFRGDSFEFGITIPSGSRATNTYVEVYKILVNGVIEERK